MGCFDRVDGEDRDLGGGVGFGNEWHCVGGLSWYWCWCVDIGVMYWFLGVQSKKVFRLHLVSKVSKMRLTLSLSLYIRFVLLLYLNP